MEESITRGCTYLNGKVKPDRLLGSYWTFAGTGDFNHDGYADILWTGAGGEVSIWDMNNNQVIGGGAVTQNGTAANTGTYWKVAGTGDFNHDGYADILLRGAGGNRRFGI